MILSHRSAVSVSISHRGFTLGEVVATLTIALILAAIGGGGYIALRDQSAADTARVNLVTVANAETSWASTSGGYTVEPTDLTSLAAGLTLLNGGTSESTEQVSLIMSESGSLGLAAKAGDVCVVALLPPVGSGTSFSERPDGIVPCDGSQALLDGDAALVP